MRPCAAGLCLAVTLCAGAAARDAEKDPSIGYLYPAGGRQGTTVRLVAGGQFLRDVSGIVLTGTGVTVASVHFEAALTPMQLQELGRRLTELRDRLMPNPGGQGRGPAPPKNPPPANKPAAVAKPGAAPAPPPPPPEKPVELPAEHPWVKILESKNLAELKHLGHMLKVLRQQPPKRSIAELAVMELRIAADAPPGDRELRVHTSAGMSNPLRFQVGTLPEIEEREPNGPDEPAQPAVDTPALFNGQILPGDVDRFRFRARARQHLVIEAQARRLIPYMADAVPGWFQAVLTLYDAKGKEVAYADHWRSDQDPVILYQVLQDGEYTLEIRDSIYRGREDFVYRLAVGETPFITQVFPLGGRTGAATEVSISGWNLPVNKLTLDTRPGPEPIRQTALRVPGGISNSVSYAVNALPECAENEPNDTPGEAQRLSLPQILNGRIGKPGDVDVFQFEGHAGEEVVAEVHARRLGSPLDSLLRLTDASGKVLAWNDDTEDKGTGLNTHHADSYIRCKLPANGAYFVNLSDAQGHGGEEYAYRLRVSAPRPDFALRVTPSSVDVAAGCAAPLTVHALRKDGFSGEIQLVLKDAPAGFSLSGGVIPAERNSVRLTLSGTKEERDQPVALHLEGRARINGEAVSRAAVPAEDMMQAFDYRHLVTAEKLLVSVTATRWRTPAMTLNDPLPLKIPLGGSVRVHVRVPLRMRLGTILMELSDPPKGLSVGDVQVGLGQMNFALKADAQALKPGCTDNLMVEVFAETTPGGAANAPAPNPAAPPAPKPKQRTSLGILPAIPFQIVGR